MSKKSLILTGFLIVACITVGLVIIKPWQKEPQIGNPQPPSQHISAGGEQILVSIVSRHENGTPVPGVKVILTDEVQGTSIVGTTTDQGKTDISLIAGHVYNFTAEFNALNKSTEHTFNQPEIAEVLISTDGTIDSILFEQNHNP